MYYLNKIVGWTLSPIGLLYIGLAVGWVFRRIAQQRERARWCRRLGLIVIVVSLVQAWILGCGVTTRLIGVPLEREFAREGKMCGEIDDLQPVDAIVLLGGGMGAHEKCHAPEMFQGSDRVRQAALLWKAYHSRGTDVKIFCTGDGVEHGTVPFLEEMGVVRKDIVFSEEPRNTAEEVALMKTHHGVETVALVTSAWHTKRARLLFEREGLKVVPFPTDFEMMFIMEAPLQIRDFFPSADGIMHNSAAVKEWVALAGYSLFSRRGTKR